MTTTRVASSRFPVKDVHDSRGVVVVQGRGGLVGKHDLRLVKERARDGRALLFAHTQFVRPGLGAVRNAESVEHGTHAVEHLRGHTALGELVGQGEVLLNGQALHKVRALEDHAQGLSTPIVDFPVRGRTQILPRHIQDAGLGLEHATQQVKQGGFARARLAEQEHPSPG